MRFCSEFFYSKDIDKDKKTTKDKLDAAITRFLKIRNEGIHGPEDLDDKARIPKEDDDIFMAIIVVLTRQIIRCKKPKLSATEVSTELSKKDNI